MLPTLTKQIIGGLHLLAVEVEATQVEEAEATEAVEAVAEVEAAVEVDEEVVAVAEEGVEGMVFCLIPTIPTGTTPRLSGPSSQMSRGSKLERARQRHNEARGRTAAAVGTGGNNGGNNDGNNGNNNGDAAQIAAQAAAQVIAQLQIAPQPAAAPVAQPVPQLQLPPLPQHAHAAVAAVGTNRTVGAVARQPGPGLGGMMSRRGH